MEQPKPSMCAYRLKPRNKARRAHKSVSTEISNSETREESHTDGVYPTAITASNAGAESGSREQLVYGPTSTFAFIRIFHESCFTNEISYSMIIVTTIRL